MRGEAALLCSCADVATGIARPTGFGEHQSQHTILAARTGLRRALAHDSAYWDCLGRQ